MASRDRILAVVIALLWGMNFVAIDITLGHFPPLLAAALRFTLIAIPVVLFVPPPRVPLRWLLGYGLGTGTCQFAFLFVGMELGMPAGLASLVLQASAPFTVLLGAFLLAEPVRPVAALGVVIAAAGMALIGWQRSEHAALLPMALTLLGALSWAAGNLCVRKARPDSALRFTVWMAVVPPLPLLTLSLLTEGPGTAWRAVSTINSAQGWAALAGLAYVALFGSVIAAALWAVLMGRNPAGTVAPFSMLVPVVGMSAAFVLLGERPTVVELFAALLVIGGVLLGSRPARGGADAARSEPHAGGGVPAATSAERDRSSPARISSA
ncbi:EamA family transporter [Haloechinothrix sp. YIM 98757]|uniref:EamA family transporter n=1 Tax=Haloechinothrix aidingensis TaxID=2752311 RepID=A0A838ADZ8_9PSEU|nr:EamA family transporter [Haloechinothrix aidingensis]